VGSGFSPPSYWTRDYSNAQGWAAEASYWETLRFPDLNGDGKADVCGRGVYGLYCAAQALEALP
jgi:hypothetical protein